MDFTVGTAVLSMTSLPPRPIRSLVHVYVRVWVSECQSRGCVSTCKNIYTVHRHNINLWRRCCATEQVLLEFIWKKMQQNGGTTLNACGQRWRSNLWQKYIFRKMIQSFKGCGWTFWASLGLSWWLKYEEGTEWNYRVFAVVK